VQLNGFFLVKRKIKEELRSFEIEGRQIPLILRRHPYAQRMILRLNIDGDGAVITIPMNASSADAFDLVRRKSHWLYHQMNKLGDRIFFGDGVQIPFQGMKYVIRHLEGNCEKIWIKNGEINVSGEIEKLSSHLGFWLKKQAHTTIIPLAQYKASQINKTISRVTICDTRSRWGSCSAKGKLSFSWRLIMAPPEILDYVVAHEVSHLAHMDHSSRFWATVEILSKNVKEGRSWLKNNGLALHRIG
tara:strand:+ start:3937 stop:4671 length:735 start_codon:yes stop_codon:yes gene_type:complete